MVLVINALIQYFAKSTFPIIDPKGLAFFLFLVALFLTERFRIYYINALLFIVAIAYYSFLFVKMFLNGEWCYPKIVNLFTYGFVVVILIGFMGYPIKIIKAGKIRKAKNPNHCT